MEVFAEEFRSAQNIHLKNFYIIIPPLSINFVDYILQGKDKLSKKKTSGGFFTDDGFAIGNIIINFLFIFILRNCIYIKTFRTK